MQKDRDIYVSSNKSFEGVKNLDLLSIENIKASIELDNYDILIFTSKNAVLSFSWQYDIKDKRCCAISDATAKVLKELGANVIFTGKKGHGDQFAIELLDILQNKKALYLRGQKTASDLHMILNKNKIDCDEVIVYRSGCNKKVIKKPEKNSVIIFTSPSNVECFMNTYSWDDSYFVVAIGNTTAKKLKKGIKYTVSSVQSIENCIEIARQI